MSGAPNRAPQPVNRNELMAQARGEVTSQATTIEQSRAIAQVQGALVVAQNRPRDTMAAANRMREACQNHRLAERAFFSYSRGGGTVTGPSIHLATELARCWGNLDYGITELRRDDAKHESEMLAYAWDLETNLRATNSFIVPHKRDKRGGAELLTDMRDVYENNANQAARRLRECIFRALPGSYREEAQELCRATLEHGGGEPIETQREKMVEAFSGLGIAPRRLAKRVGKPVDKFTAFDLGELRIAFRSIRTGEADAGELFPDDSGADAVAELKAAAKPEPTHKPAENPEMAEPAKKRLMDVLDANGLKAVTDSSTVNLLAGYRKVKADAADKAAIAVQNLELLRYLAQFASGQTLAGLQGEIAAAEVLSDRDEQGALV
jgi:hypothetical protein